MTKNEVKLIIAELVESYPGFDASDENIDRHFKYLADFPFEVAMQNVEEYIKTSKYPPIIADIRGRLGDQMEAQRSKDDALDHFANLDAWIAGSVPPPEGYWERGRKAIRGESNE